MTPSPRLIRKIRMGLGLAAFALLTAFAFIPSAEAAESAGPLAPASLRCEYLVDPMGIDVAKPRFFWVIGHAERGQTPIGLSDRRLDRSQGRRGRHLGQRQGRLSQVDPGPVRRQGPRERQVLLLEGPQLGPGRPRKPLEHGRPLRHRALR